jgi:hypothetical protein
LLLAVVVLTLQPARVMAYRPFVSTDAAVADSGEVEVEFGYAGFRQNGARSTIVAPTVVGNLGIVRDVELVAESKVVSDLVRERGRDAARFEDTAVSVKWIACEGVLQERGTLPSLAVEAGVVLPTVRGEDRPGGELTGIASGRAHGWTYHLNAGLFVEPGGVHPGPEWGIIVEHPLGGALRAVAEVNGESFTRSRADNSALVGAIYDVTTPTPLHELSLDVGIRHGISRDSDEWGGTAGFTIALPVWEHGTAR